MANVEFKLSRNPLLKQRLNRIKYPLYQPHIFCNNLRSSLDFVVKPQK